MHFTWKDPDFKTLKQGDLLKKTPELVALLKKVHPHYTNDEYTYFQILTQSCDLFRRGKAQKCNSRYITLAAVRKLDDIMKRKIDEIAKSQVTVDGITYCRDDCKLALKQFVKKLFNNNDKEYFFLREEPAHGLIEDSCTMLHLTISIRAYEHYETCLSAKILELDEVFQAKLGWTVGNLYSRVGTEDYVPGALPDDSSFDAFIEETLSSHIAWVPANIFSEFNKAARVSASIEEIKKKIDERISRKKDSKISQIIGLVKMVKPLTSEEEKALKNSFSQNSLIQKVLL